jgi:Skp family chaperone for outer membrane proteins
MIKRIVEGIGPGAAFLVLLTGGVSIAAAQQAPLKIAVVDVEVVVAQSPQGKDLQARLERFQTEVQQELQRLQEGAQGIRQRIADGSNSLSEERLSELNKELEDATIAIRRYRDDKQRQGQKLQDEGLREIEQVLQPVFAQVREEMGFDVIFNRVPGVVLMISERVDVTPLIVERLNATLEPTSE